MSIVNDPKKEKNDAAGMLDDIFGEEEASGGTSKALADLELLSVSEVLAESEAVLQELRIRQGD